MENNNDQKVSKWLLLFNLLMVSSIVFVILVIYSKDNPQKKIEVSHAEVSEPIFKDVQITAKSAYVYDVAQAKVIYKKNEFAQLPLASITKLMMALTAIDLFPKNSEITIMREFLSEEGDSGLLANESWDMKNLLDFSLVVSSNDGARSIASVIGATKLNTTDYDLGRKEFVKMMNMKAQDLGLRQTYFINENGLDVGSTSGGYGSAIDVANLLTYILSNRPEILEATKYERIDIDSNSKIHSAKNTNKEVNGVPGLIASKTGYTEMAGGNLAIAFDASMQRPIIIVVLGSTQQGRFTDVETLVRASLEYVGE